MRYALAAMAKIVITGANRGIGLELVRQRATTDEVFALCREPSAELRELPVKLETGVDVTDDAAVRAVAERIGSPDIVINNAGILKMQSLSNLNFDLIRQQFEVNSLAPLRVATTFAPAMSTGGKIAVVTSRMGSIADNTSGGSYGYRMSKVAVNMAFTSLAKDLQPKGIAVAILHPGFVKTEMTGGNGNVTPAESASMLWERIDSLDLASSGTFWHANGDVLPW